MRDAMSRRFYYGENLEILRQLKAQGFDLQSHSVSHCERFDSFPLGSGWEKFGDYRPYVDTNNFCVEGTVFGEVRVSKSLLDGEIPGQSTVFFRAGHLKYPFTLPEVLERCGYEFNSSMTAGDVTTGFPYAIPDRMGYDRDSAIYEFPVTIEDEEKPWLGDRLDSALEVIEANAENGAMNVLLIHPNDLDKAKAEATLLQRLPKDIPASDMLSFARFWRARDRLIWQIQPTAKTNEVELTAVSLEPVSGLTLEFQRSVEGVEGAPCQRLDPHRLVLPPLVPQTPLKCRIRYAP
jgi:peptidoglycan/xylan/chitin deacetylase (PgdA/CDA1 family)